MNSSGDAAEQIVRMSLEGAEVVAKVTGTAAKNIAALIYTILKNKDKNKVKGRQRLTSMLKSGKELKVFTVGEENLKQFALEAKRYGVVFCALKSKSKSNDGTADIMVRVEDAYKINRIAEKFKFATVDVGTIKSEIEKTREGKTSEKSTPEKDIPNKADADKLVDDLMKKPTQKEENTPQNPQAAKTAKSHPSELISDKPDKTAVGTTDPIKSDRPSVREKLRSIKAEQKTADTREDRSISDKPRSQKAAQHKQPPAKKRTRKSKER